MNLKELREAKAAKEAEYDALLKATEGREMTDVEGAQVDKFLAELRSIDTNIERAHEIEKEALRRAKSAGAVQTGVELPKESAQDKRDLSKFSVARLIRSQIKEEGVTLDGIEKEMSDEAKKEAREMGQEIRGVGIPSRILSKRDNSVTMATQPEDGSAVVETDVRDDLSMLDMLRNALVTRQLGATYLNDLVGNISFTKMTERPIATWKPEVGTLAKSNVKFDAEELAPKRLGTYTLHSLQFLRQTAPAIERKIREEIAYSLQEGVDVAAIMGTGSDNQPTGILNHADVPAITALGTAGGNLDRAALIAIETALTQRNLRGTSYGWLMNALTRGYLKNAIIAPGSDKFIMDKNNSLLDYPVVMSNMVPSNLTKDTGTGLSALIFGDWKELYIAQWGGVDLIVDPYTLAADGQIKIVAQGFFNVMVHRPEAFAYYKDVITSTVTP